MVKNLLVYQWEGNFNFKKIKIFDSFESLIIYKNYGKCDTFELGVVDTVENVQIFRAENVINFDGVYYYIDDVSSGSNSLKICGKSLAGKYDSRMIDRVYTANKFPELIALDHFNQEMINPSDYNNNGKTYSGNDRKISYLKAKTPPSFGNQAIDYQVSYEYVQTQVEKLCETYNFGFKELGTKGKVENTIRWYKGNDVSRWVVFSDNTDGYENLSEVEFEHSTFDEKTVAYVFGEGEGEARKKTIVNPNLKGLERKEIYVDAQDLKSKNETTGAVVSGTAYNNMLIDRGKQAMTDKKAVITLNGDFILGSKLIKFGRDFNVGDQVKLVSKRYNVTKIATITQAKHTYDTKGEHIELTYDRETPTIYEVQGRK